MDVRSSGSISWLKSGSCSVSLADVARVNDSAQGRDVYYYPYPAGKLTIWRGWAPEVLLVEAGGVLGRGGIGSGVGSGVCCLHLLAGGAPVPLRPQRISGFFAVPFWQGRHWGMWFRRSIAGCLSIAAFNLLCPGNSISSIISSRISAQGFLN